MAGLRDELLGRVLAVEMVFISASNELGAFESGVAASLVGAVPAVVAGGVITIALALIWTRLFPSLARIDPARGPAARSRYIRCLSASTFATNCRVSAYSPCLRTAAAP